MVGTAAGAWAAPFSPLPLAIQEVIDARVVRCCAQWPIFIGLNMLAGALRAASNALTPPPIKMLEMSMAYHQTSAPGGRLAVTVGPGQSQTVAVGARSGQPVAVEGDEYALFKAR